SLDFYDRTNSHGRLSRGPEMELMRGGGLLLGRYDSADSGRGFIDHDATGNRGRAVNRSRGARAFRYSCTLCKGYNSRSHRVAGVASGARSATSQPLNADASATEAGSGR